MTHELAHKIYNILVKYGASPGMRMDFVYHHCDAQYITDEWRFCGVFGFGGKYRRKRNSVDAYPEDITPDMQIKLTQINQELAELN